MSTSGLAGIGIFADLSDQEREALAAELKPIRLNRGDVLVRQGEEADALYIVVSGRFQVKVTGQSIAIAEIGPGSPIGEIAFLAGGPRTATVTAVRDSLVVRLEREKFDHLCRRIPGIWATLTATLARRLAAQTSGKAMRPTQTAARTIAVIRAGPNAVPDRFIEQLTAAIGKVGRSIAVRSDTIADIIGSVNLSSDLATEALNALENAHETVLYVADPDLNEWSEKAMRQADLILRVGYASDHPDVEVAENVLELFADGLAGAAQQRLVLVHAEPKAPRGTRHWLSKRRIAMHHHAALGVEEDVARLVRFLTGRAVGLVACGGGALCAAHVGIYQALLDAGVTIDIMGGTSGGSAMAAAFAMGLSPDEIDRAVHDIFVTRRALRRYTWPRYSLLDHTGFDRILRLYYGGIDIEDLWLPYFAVSTNLSRYGAYCHRSGDLWSAVRASSSIPALLPPVYTDDGQMLVDGALVANVPVAAMRELKAGPNIVIAFELPQLERFNVDYKALPSRGALVRRMLLPFPSHPLPDAPSLGNVLMRSLLANRQDFEQHLTIEDLLLVPPLPSGMGVLEWHRHVEVMGLAHGWAVGELAARKTAGNSVFAKSKQGPGPGIIRAYQANAGPALAKL